MCGVQIELLIRLINLNNHTPQFYTVGVCILSELAHWTPPYEISYTICGRFNQDVTHGVRISFGNEIVCTYVLNLIHFFFKSKSFCGIHLQNLPQGKCGFEMHQPIDIVAEMLRPLASIFGENDFFIFLVSHIFYWHNLEYQFAKINVLWPDNWTLQQRILWVFSCSPEHFTFLRYKVFIIPATICSCKNIQELGDIVLLNNLSVIPNACALVSRTCIKVFLFQTSMPLLKQTASLCMIKWTCIKSITFKLRAAKLFCHSFLIYLICSIFQPHGAQI